MDDDDTPHSRRAGELQGAEREADVLLERRSRALAATPRPSPRKTRGHTLRATCRRKDSAVSTRPPRSTRTIGLSESSVGGASLRARRCASRAEGTLEAAIRLGQHEFTSAPKHEATQAGARGCRGARRKCDENASVPADRTCASPLRRRTMRRATRSPGLFLCILVYAMGTWAADPALLRELAAFRGELVSNFTTWFRAFGGVAGTVQLSMRRSGVLGTQLTLGGAGAGVVSRGRTTAPPLPWLAQTSRQRQRSRSSTSSSPSRSTLSCASAQPQPHPREPRVSVVTRPAGFRGFHCRTL